MDSVPLVALTGQVRTDLIGNDAFQEADTTGITRPVTKYNSIVKNIKDLERTVREAFHIASHRPARPGPGRSARRCLRRQVPLQRQGRDRPARLPHPHARATPARSRWPPRRSTSPSGPSSTSAAASSSPTPPRSCAAFAEKAHLPVTMTLLGLGSLRPAQTRVARHARHARLGLRQLRRPGVRPAHRHRRPVRRPRHRQGRHLRPQRQDRPHRHRPVEHLEERPGRYPRRRRRQAHPGRADEGGRVPRARPRGSPRSPSGRRSTRSATTRRPRRSSRNT